MIIKSSKYDLLRCAVCNEVNNQRIQAHHVITLRSKKCHLPLFFSTYNCSFHLPAAYTYLSTLASFLSVKTRHTNNCHTWSATASAEEGNAVNAISHVCLFPFFPL